MLKKLATVAIVGAFCIPSLPAFADTTVTFTVPSNFTGGSVNGFTFSDNWRNYGSDDQHMPFMEWYDQKHSIAYDLGAFNFQGLSLGGWPWDGYGATSGNSLVTMQFKDINGQLIETDQIQLALDNSFQTFSKSIANVHEIVFLPLGGYTGPSGGWVEGSWPRLASVSIAPVPEPETYALFMAGLGLLGMMAKRKRMAA